jgi:hypothetical protein
MKMLSKLAAALAPALIVSALCAGEASGAEPVPASAPQAAVWQKHQYSFVFMGFTSTYSCDGLADKLEVLLTAAGARPDSTSRPGACASPFGRPDRFARAELTFYTLAPAGEAKAGDAERALGIWHPVRLAIGSPRELANGDCEVVEQFRDQVLPMFTTRNVDDHTTCVPHQESGSVIALSFEALGAAPGAATLPVAVAPAPTVYAYPTRGQSKEQQASDRRECGVAAVAQSGFDPDKPAAPGAPAGRAAYDAAFAGCLTQRGYSVR